MALLPLPDLKGFENLYGLLVGQHSEPTARTVLEWAKPTWLTEFLLQQANRGSWSIYALCATTGYGNGGPD